MSRFVIPVGLVRRVYGDLTDRFESRLRLLNAGQPVSPGGVIGLGKLLRRLGDIWPHRQALADLLQAGQDAHTGLISGGPEYECWPKVLAEATSSMRALGCALKYPVRKLQELCDVSRLLAWVAGRNWDHPWGGPTGAGHMVGGVLFAMSDLGMLAQNALDAVFDYLDSLRDEKYGVWAKGHFDPDDPGWAQLGGAYYFAVIYDRFRRPLPNPHGACGMLIEMQQKTDNGSFCIRPEAKWPFGSTDHDALYVLTRHSRLDAELRLEVMPAVERYARYFVRQMTDERTYLSEYPIPKILPILRSVFPDPDDDVPYWDYEMYEWPL